VSAAKRPTLVLLAGPNGAGKTTLYEQRVAPSLKVPFINADLIQRDALRDTRVEAAYEAARLAEAQRRQHFDAGTSFATETVFSHPSKLDLIIDGRERGYRIFLFHVGVGSPDLSVARVAERVKEGGHPVPEAKIRARYDRNGPLIREAALLADFAHVYDNSALNTPPERVLSMRESRVSFVAPQVPEWVRRIYERDIAGAAPDDLG